MTRDETTLSLLEAKRQHVYWPVWAWYLLLPVYLSLPVVFVLYRLPETKSQGLGFFHPPFCFSQWHVSCMSRRPAVNQTIQTNMSVDGRGGMRGDYPQVNQLFSQTDEKTNKKPPKKLPNYFGSHWYTWAAHPMCSFLKMATLQSVFNLCKHTASAPTPLPGSCHHLQQQYQNSLYT